MKRRTFLTGLSGLPFISQARAAEWDIRLIRNSQATAFGLHIRLAAGWKTYWRQPGEGGIPPSIQLDGTPAKIQYPLPQRISEPGGEAIGYHDEVVLFLAHAKPESTVQAFLGVCQQICRPVKFAGALAQAAIDDRLVESFTARLPQTGQIALGATQAANPLTSATAPSFDLLLNLASPFEDVFVESSQSYYFRKVEIHGTRARFAVEGLPHDQPLKGEILRLTAANKGKALEQEITVA